MFFICLTDKLNITIAVSICSVSDVRENEYIAYALPLVQFKLLKENGERVIVETQTLDFCKKEGNRYALQFKKIGGYDLSCTLTVTAGEELSFDLNIENQTGLTFEAVAYPNFALKPDLIAKGGKHKIYWSIVEGLEITDTCVKDWFFPCDMEAGVMRVGWSGLYPGPISMQFMAYYDDEYGLYFASHDDKGNVKYLDFCAKDGGIEFLHEAHPERAFDKNFSMEYPVVLKGFKGDSWYEAAEIYREWLYTTDIIKLPEYEHNDTYPTWIKENPICLMYPVRGEIDHGEMPLRCYYPYTNGFQYVQKYNELLGVKALVLLAHWEGTAPWAPPYVWPPFGDYQNFVQYIDMLHESGNYIGLYCSGTSWTEKSFIVPSYNTEEFFTNNHLEEYMELYPDQTLRYSRILGRPYRLSYDMCPSCEWVKKTVVNEVEKIAKGCELDYLQFFDQNLGGSTSQCYSKEHHHPPVPGKWMTTEMRDIMRKTIEKVNEVHPEKKLW